MVFLTFTFVMNAKKAPGLIVQHSKKAMNQISPEALNSRHQRNRSGLLNKKRKDYIYII